ncbi:exopolysaccharide biosynthesis polyprenyl glycosylphosphotransferase [Pseudonocardia sp. ICBG1034]|uniref:exopolysaccharide biosynthesis polyprenyl glycosylphosphotransferase n=1 Tax=Pseudonocardia sp. ICBG1034 TaxID=2844381 RepID=UPI001CC9F44D|nr:exopolysaccharide biosynthesis polyprenyl glycosylphosphotransferase [Pseudonocardia sp. ICBG1034]
MSAGPTQARRPARATPRTHHRPLLRRRVAGRGPRPVGPPARADTSSAPAPVRRLAARVSLVRTVLVLTDVVAVGTAAVVVAPTGHDGVVAASALLLAVRSAARLHRSRLRLSWFDDLPRELAALVVTMGLVLAGAMALQQNLDTRIDVAGPVEVVLLATLVALTLRAAVLFAARLLRVRWAVGEPTLIVGTGSRAVELDETMRAHPEYGLRPLGHVLSEDLDLLVARERAALSARIRDAAARHRVRVVVFACHGVDDAAVLDAAIEARRDGLGVLLLPWLSELVHDHSGVERLRSIPLLRLPADPRNRLSWRLKRLGDVVVSALALALASPLLVAVALAVLVESGRPVIFRQERIGLDNLPFTVLKFRSMRPVDEREQQTRWSIAGDARVGPVGRLIRRTSLDELPQLWNILRGDMSLVGPRPERPSFVERFSAEHERYTARHRVPVGLTGLAQISGLRGDTSIADRVRHDNYYIANWSLWLDAQIVVRTARELVRRGRH